MKYDNYIAAFDKDGNRIGTILCEYNPSDDANAGLLEADKKKAAEISPDAKVIELIDQETFEKYMDNHVRDMTTGKPVKYVAPEATEEEKKAQAQTTALAKVDTAASTAYTSGFTSSANETALIYDSDSFTQTEIQTGAITATTDQFTNQFPNGFPIRTRTSETAEKQAIYLTAAQLITLATDWVNRYKEIKSQVWTLQAQIKACTTAAEIEAISIIIK